MDLDDSERLHKIIVNLFYVVLEGRPVIPTHDLYQHEP